MYEKSVYHIKCANELWNTKFQFDIEEQKKYFYQCQKLYSDNLLVGKATPSKKTIFIVGMPRCGSTLVEQILSSHSKVHAMGETDLFSRTVDTILQTVEFASNQNHVLESVHEQYSKMVETLAVDEEYITDKMLFNFVWIGVIFSLFPDAKVIHVKRVPMATCWSIYKHLFANNGIQFAYSQENIATYYNLCVDMMTFWEQKYPNRILHVNYEQLTEETGIDDQRYFGICRSGVGRALLEIHEQNPMCRPHHLNRYEKKSIEEVRTNGNFLKSTSP